MMPPSKPLIVPSSSWKGALTDTVVVWTPDNEGACGFAFQEGEHYLVFAKTRARSISTSLMESVGFMELSLRNTLRSG